MAKNVVCKKCKNLVNDWCEKVIDSPDPDMQRYCQHFREKPKKISLVSDGEEETVCHCNVKENAELIAKILDYDVQNQIADIGKMV